MRIIVHLSDIHFGRVHLNLVEPLIRSVNQLKPDVVAISGDLTQRARTYQFKEARAFLDTLPKPQIVVPGNHDVPLHNLFTRFFQPLDKYRRYITEDLQPFHADDEIAIVGVNTARSFTFKGGRVNQTQIESVREKLCPLPDEVTKAIVTHHPFDLPEGHHEADLVGRSRMAMEMLASEKLRSANSSSGISGSRRLCACHQTKIAISTSPAMIRPQTVMGPAMVPQSNW